MEEPLVGGLNWPTSATTRTLAPTDGLRGAMAIASGDVADGRATSVEVVGALFRDDPYDERDESTVLH